MSLTMSFTRSNESGSSQEDSDEPTTDEGTDEELDEDIEEQDWSQEINRREGVEFQEEVGITVGSENLQFFLDFFSLFITEEVWQLLVNFFNFNFNFIS